MAYQQVDIFIKNTTPQHDPSAGVVVNVYTPDGALLVTQGTTDADGYVGFLLEEALYQLRYFKFSTSFPNPQVIDVVPGTNSFDVPATVLTPPVANDLRLCTAFGYFRDPTGAPAANVDIQFITKFKPVLLEDAAVLTERVTVRTDHQGYAQLNLIRCGMYDVTIAGFEDYQRCISVPDALNVNLPDLLFPVVYEVLFDPPVPPTMSVGDPDVQYTPTALVTDGNTLNPQETCNAVQFSSSDPNVLGLLIAGGIITLRPLSAGTASVRGVRNDKTIVRIPEPGVQGVPITVVVS